MSNRQFIREPGRRIGFNRSGTSFGRLFTFTPIREERAEGASKRHFSRADLIRFGQLLAAADRGTR